MGGAFSCSVYNADFDMERELRDLRDSAPHAGALLSFQGIVRGRDEAGAVHWLELEHYPGMTEQFLHTLFEEARQCWDIAAARIIHRVGRLPARDNIVLVAVAATHRKPAFAACEFLVDALKTRVPLWKKSCGETGEHWVQATGEEMQEEVQEGMQGSAKSVLKSILGEPCK